MALLRLFARAFVQPQKAKTKRFGLSDPFGDADDAFEKPLALASLSRAFALIRATLSRSQADLVLFLITKPVREPFFRSINTERDGVPRLLLVLAGLRPAN